MYSKLNKKAQIAVDFLMIILGTFIMGFSFSVFLEPNNISTGGFSGLAMIINALLELVNITFLTTSIIYFILNIGLFLYGIKALGKMFAIKALVGIASFSIAMELFALIDISITYETLISAVYGGALMGIGVGIVVRFGGSTGGGDMIASIVKSKAPHLTIGKVTISIDMFVIATSLFVFPNGIEMLPYTILALLLCFFALDFINEGYRQVRAYNIITTKPNEISDLLMNKLARGCTMTKAVGMHTKDDKYIVTCLISKFQSNYLKRILKESGIDAFVYSVAVGEVMGEWAKDSELPTEEKTKKQTKNDVK